jgi:hypothetical protein
MKITKKTLKKKTMVTKPTKPKVLDDYTEDTKKEIEKTLEYGLTLVGLPYRFHTGDTENIVLKEDKFWVKGDHPITSDYIKKECKSITCTGLINLIRKHNGLMIAGKPGSGMPKFYEKFPGTTGAWFNYFKRNKRLHPFNPKKTYPRGTLLLANYKDLTTDQGHVAILITEGAKSVLDEKILHARADASYEESIKSGKTDHGATVIEPLALSHLHWYEDRSDDKGHGYYTHICYPDDWMIIN